MATNSRRKHSSAATLTIAAILAFSFYILGCAGVTQPTPSNGSPSPATVSSITISPNPASLTVNGSQQFAATLQGTSSNKTITWSASAGVITTSGLYTAPSKAGTATVTATSEVDSTKRASATVAIAAASSSAPLPPNPTPLINSLSASPATVQPGQSSLLQWNVTGAASLDLTQIGLVNGTHVNVTPADTTTYTLTATNASISVFKNVTVTVQGPAPQNQGLGSATVDATKPGIQIPATYMGLSHEWDGPAVLMGQPGNTNPIYRQLVKNLLAYGAGPIVIRIGGNSTDSTGEPTANTVAPMAQLATDIGAKFTLGVNLGSDNAQLAVDQAKDYVANMPEGSLDAVEIGNETDLYYENGHRPSSYTFSDYFADFATWRGQIQPLLPKGVKLMGPSWALKESLPNLPAFLAQEQKNLSIVSQHYYGSGAGTGNPSNYLLQDSAATKGAQAMASSVVLVHNAGLPFRIGEMNSIAGGGQSGVSDAFASALWSVDTLFEFANVGVDGVNFHGISSPYALFTCNFAISGGKTTFWLTSVRPEYYGLLLFQQATANGAKLLPVTLTTQANLKVWATLDSKGVVRVVLINKDQTAQGVVNISLSGLGSALVTRLIAPSYQSTSGVTIGGQTFDGSLDGTIQGTAQSEVVTPVGGVYSVAVSPTSAAVLTVQP